MSCGQRGWNLGGSGELGTAICSELPEQEVAATMVTTKRLRVLLEEDHLLDCS